MKVIYVDDEFIQLENFRLSSQNAKEIDSLNCFSQSEEALKWAQEHPVDLAFLDIEMPVMNGIELARRLKQINVNIKIVFVTAYEQYALEAFEVRAMGYLLKPYGREDIQKELEHAAGVRLEHKQKRIQITTMPDLLIMLDGKRLSLGHTRQEELFALLVDRGRSGITRRDALDCIWEEKPAGDSAYWACLSRLKSMLEEAGLPDLLLADGYTRYLNTELVDCDLYQMLDGNRAAIEKYNGEYLKRYSWAEERNAQLYAIKEAYTKRKDIYIKRD